jgi:hypothetical protein
MPADAEFLAVKDWLADPRRVGSAAQAIRLAIDWVIDGARTRRFSVDQLQSNENVQPTSLYQWDSVKERELDKITKRL